MRIANVTVTLRWAVIIALAALGFGTNSEAQTPTAVKEAAKAVDFKGKTITIIVGSSAGGGWDTGARSTALTLQKILPGNPRVVVQNVPGGDGDRALRRMGDPQTPRDGTVIMPVHGRFFLDAILGKPHSHYDPEKQFVAALRSRQTGHLLWVWKEIATSWDQLMAMPCCLTLAAGERFGGEASESGPHLAAMLGAPIKIIWGYAPGSRDRAAAFARHETKLHAGWTVARHFPELIKRREIVPVLWWGDLAPRDFEEWTELLKAGGVTENPPNLFDAMKVPNNMRVAFTVATEAVAIHRGSYAVPPGTPVHIREFWERTMAEVPKDPEWKKRLLAAGISPTDLGYTPREKVLAMRKAVLELGPEEKKMFMALLSGEELDKSKK
jgi:tripartite-type tricarboxylate transporter receptor subunit TctC